MSVNHTDYDYQTGQITRNDHDDVSAEFAVQDDTQTLEDCFDLIEWFGRMYPHSEPLFPDTEWGNRMRGVWRLVHGVKERFHGEWVMCDECGQWHVDNVGSLSGESFS